MNLKEAFGELDKIYESADHLTEDAWLSRNELITEIRKLGYEYKFYKYTDAQLSRILDKTREKVKRDKQKAEDELRKAEEEQAYAELVSSEKELKPTCDDCGTVLTDGGYCPVCDDGVEDLIEAKTEMESSKYSLADYGKLIGKTGGVIRTQSLDGTVSYLVTSDLGLKNHIEITYSTAKEIISAFNLIYDKRRSNNLFAYFTTEKNVKESFSEASIVEDIFDDNLVGSSRRSNWISAPANNSIQTQTSPKVQSPTVSNNSSNASTPTVVYRPNIKKVVTIVYDTKAHKLRARADDGVNGPANVAFPNSLRTEVGQQYEVEELIWNGKNYRVSGKIIPV